MNSDNIGGLPLHLSNAADWHATMALKAYRKRQYKDYRRHIRIADELRKEIA